MASIDEKDGRCLVFTYREGALSALGHDLVLEVGRFSLDVDLEQGTLRATFDASSLRVLGAAVNGSPDPSQLSDKDRREIEATLAREVLEVRRFPEVSFVASRLEPEGDDVLVEGTLSLHGRSRPLSVRAHARGRELVAEVRLHQPDFGIRPYKALLGALKVKPDVTVSLSVPRPN